MRLFRLSLLAVLLTSAPLAALAQDLDIPPARYPDIPAFAEAPEGFVPAGWVMEASGTDDLNQDKALDVVMVLHGADPKLKLSNAGGLGVDVIDTNPRLLLVAFYDFERDGYRLAARNDTLITRWTDPVLDDVFSTEKDASLTVAKGVFKVKLYSFASAGGWSMGNTEFTFRWQNNRFEMIGYDASTVQRNSGETRDVSINYSTGKAKISTGRIDSDAETVTWTRVKDRRLKSLDEVGDGMAFDSGFGG